jgi:glycine C-acetyltransferase
MDATIRTSDLDSGQNDFKFLSTMIGDKTVAERARYFSQFLQQTRDNGTTYGRLLLSPTDREVIIKDPFTGENRKMLMFASNNYLGFANHPYIKGKVKKAIDKYGVGLGGPPLLNGYTKLMQELEERLADLKDKESAMIFSTGYTANVGLITSLVKQQDIVICDELSHSSFIDGIRMANVKSEVFEHNNLQQLESILIREQKRSVNLFVGVEGVYSMDGDVAPLNEITRLCKKYNALVLLDDAHGTGVLGNDGSGTAQYFNCQKEIDITMGTFSKCFAMTGGFLAGPKEVIESMRYLGRPYMFSAALPPVTLAAILGGLDLVEKEPQLRDTLLGNASYAAKKLAPLGLCAEPEAAIITVKVPERMDIRRLNYEIHLRGIFLNSIEFPAVAQNQERLRISVTSRHTKSDIDFLVNTLFDLFSAEEYALTKKEVA